jgi:hypothetical protein
MNILAAFQWLCAILEVVLCAALLIQSAQRAPVNHVGYDIRLLYLLPLIHLAAVVLPGPVRMGLRLAHLVPILGLAGMLFLFDRSNLLVQYDLWVKRGMPERGRVLGK